MQEVEASKISRQSAREGGKVVIPTHQPHLSLGDNPDNHLLEAGSAPGP